MSTRVVLGKPSGRPGGGPARLRRAPDALLAAALLAGGALIGYFGRYWSFFYDEWGTIFYRRSGGLSSFLAAHNGHLEAAVVAVYRVLFATAGLRSYHPYQGVMIAAHLVLVSLIYVYARQRVGPWAALLATLPLLLLASAWQVIFWANELEFVFPLIALLVAMLWRRPLVSGLAVALALASSGLGVAVAVGVLILALSGPDRARHLVAWTIPVIGYALWFFAYRPSGLPPTDLRQVPGASPTGDIGSFHFTSSNIARAPAYVLHSAKAAAGALIGTQAGGWWMLAALAIAVLGVAALRWRPRSARSPLAALSLRRGIRSATAFAVSRSPSAELVALLATAFVFWIETALIRAQAGAPESSGTSRYLYPGAVLLVMILVEALDGLQIPWPVIGSLAIGMAFVVHADIGLMRSVGQDARGGFARQAALLRRAQCDPRLPADLSLAPVQAPGVTVGPYLAAVRALGSPPGQSCGRASSSALAAQISGPRNAWRPQEP